MTYSHIVHSVVLTGPKAHLKHNIRKVVILDIDLHHGIIHCLSRLRATLIRDSGNGTQAIVWGINEDYYRKVLESEPKPHNQTTEDGLQIYYGSLHDILSFPCEVSP